jgi:hypothetical protein
MQDRQIQDFRRMTPGERLALSRELARLGDKLWESNLDRVEVERRWELWRAEHEFSNAALLEGLRRRA